MVVGTNRSAKIWAPGSHGLSTVGALVMRSRSPSWKGSPLIFTALNWELGGLYSSRSWASLMMSGSTTRIRSGMVES